MYLCNMSVTLFRLVVLIVLILFTGSLRLQITHFFKTIHFSGHICICVKIHFKPPYPSVKIADLTWKSSPFWSESLVKCDISPFIVQFMVSNWNGFSYLGQTSDARAFFSRLDGLNHKILGSAGTECNFSFHILWLV